MARAQPTSTPCPHCGTAVEAPEGTYCCHGCEAAAAILLGAGLEGWYATRQQPAPRARSASDVAWERVDVDHHDDGTDSVCLSVDGFRCASCVWVTEKMLERTPGVKRAHVSYASGRATVSWDPAVTDLTTVAERIAAIGYTPRPGRRHGIDDRDLLVRLGVAAFCTMNVMGLLAPLYVGWVDGIDDRWAQLFRWAALAMSAPIITYAAVPFFRGAITGLRHRVLHMDLPVAVAVAVMAAHGLWATAAHEDAFLDSMGMLVTLLLAGRVLEARGRKHANEAASSLAAVIPRTARRVDGDAVVTVDTATLVVGDRVDLGAGDEVPADGVVVKGRGLVQMAVVTGEATAQALKVGDAVVAGAVVEDGALQVSVTRTGDATVVQQMVAGLLAAEDAPAEAGTVDRLAPWFTAGTLVAAGLTALTWGLTGGTSMAVAHTVAVLVVACPCALSLATPLVRAAGLGAVARRGLLLRRGDVLERLAAVDVVVLDKTGTVTWGTPVVKAADEEILRVAAGLERFSRHPVATAIVSEAVVRGIPIPVAEDVRETAGVGIEGTLDGRRWRLSRGGPDRVVLQDEQGVSGMIVLEDVPRAGARQDVEALLALGVRVVMLSGDAQAVASRVAEQVGITEAVGGVGPADKVAFLARLQVQGHTVAFVGDGLNDGPALAQADVGVAMAAGAASSVLVADAVLGGERLAPLLAALKAGPVVKARVRSNLTRSAVYNLVAVAAAMLGWVNPLAAAVWMPLSSGSVIASALGVERAVKRQLTKEA